MAGTGFGLVDTGWDFGAVDTAAVLDTDSAVRDTGWVEQDTGSAGRDTDSDSVVFDSGY